VLTRAQRFTRKLMRTQVTAFASEPATS
jgi:hypothetical protein